MIDKFIFKLILPIIRKFKFFCKNMIYENSVLSDQYEEVIEMFSSFLNDSVSVINSVKKSIYEILNIPLHASQVFIQPNIPSVSANCKKTLDDLKRISSILKGYSKSKNSQREEEQTRRSRIDNSSLSKQSKSKRSRISNYSNSSSGLNISKFKKPESITHKQQISMVTFQVPKIQNQADQLSDEQFLSKLKNYRSLRNLNKINEELSNSQKIGLKSNGVYLNKQQDEDRIKQGDIGKNMMELKRRRARTIQKQSNYKQVSFVTRDTEQKFRQCLSRHQQQMNEIIKRNSECIQLLKDIHKGLKKKKQKKKIAKTKQSIHMKTQPIKYQSMTPSTNRKN